MIVAAGRRAHGLLQMKTITSMPTPVKHLPWRSHPPPPAPPLLLRLLGRDAWMAR